MESFKHRSSWGRYTVIKGSDVRQDDVINFAYDNGSTAAYRTLVGQSCFRTKEVVYRQN